MAALTDLTWEQLVSQLPTGAIEVDTSGNVVINVGTVSGTPTNALADAGVVKFFSMLFTAANKAQISANESQEDGEKLSAFSPATMGAASNGYITLTRPFVCRAELATAVNIIGTNA